MIIVADKNRENVVFFEQNRYDHITGLFTITLVDRATNKSYEFVKEDNYFASYSFYSFLIDFSGLHQGEYEYVIKNNEADVVVATGIIRLNELEPDFIAHNINRIYDTYEQ